MKPGTICTAADVADAVNEIGLLPYFSCGIAGLSLEEMIDRRYWFGDVAGAWEWREQLAEEGKIAYGKLFFGKMGFASLAIYPHLANLRRDGYDFDARWEEGLENVRLKRIMDQFIGGGMTSAALKAGVGEMKGFDGALARLQMETYVTVDAFVYKRDRMGRRYGWGVGRYLPSEEKFGTAQVTGAYDAEPAESLDWLMQRIHRAWPQASSAELERLLRG